MVHLQFCNEGRSPVKCPHNTTRAITVTIAVSSPGDSHAKRRLRATGTHRGSCNEERLSGRVSSCMETWKGHMNDPGKEGGPFGAFCFASSIMPTQHIVVTPHTLVKK